MIVIRCTLPHVRSVFRPPPPPRLRAGPVDSVPGARRWRFGLDVFPLRNVLLLRSASRRNAVIRLRLPSSKKNGRFGKKFKISVWWNRNVLKKFSSRHFFAQFYTDTRNVWTLALLRMRFRRDRISRCPWTLFFRCISIVQQGLDAFSSNAAGRFKRSAESSRGLAKNSTRSDRSCDRFGYCTTFNYKKKLQ